MDLHWAFTRQGVGGQLLGLGTMCRGTPRKGCVCCCCIGVKTKTLKWGFANTAEWGWGGSLTRAVSEAGGDTGWGGGAGEYFKNSRNNSEFAC